MRHHPKSVLAITLSIAASIWWLSIQNYSSSIDERIYSRRECAEDLCKISIDLAQFSINRSDLDCAIHHLKRAIGHKSDELMPYQKLCQCYEQQAHHEESLNTYFAARHATATFSATKPAHDTRSLLHNPLPWQGENLTGKKLYIEADASEEDCICFIRFLPHLTEQKADIFCKVPEELLSLCQNSFPEVCFFTNQSAATSPSFDYYLTLQSLPAQLAITLSMLITPQGYLVTNTANTATKKLLISPDTIAVGLYWHDEQSHIAPLSILHDLAVLPHVQLYALQELPQQYTDSIIDLSMQCKTLHDTAALIKNLDIVIAIESPVADLAGAVGTPVWLLAAYKPSDWRWLIAKTGQHSAWYHDMRIFQQPKTGDWLSVFADVYESLGKLKKQAKNL